MRRSGSAGGPTWKSRTPFPPSRRCGRCCGRSHDREADVPRLMCLSVRQPWAELIVAGRKRVENRTWKTNHRGLLGIHASATDTDFLGLTDGEKADYFAGYPRDAQIWFGGLI